MLIYNMGYKNKNGENNSFEIKIDFLQDAKLEQKNLINEVLKKQQKLGFNHIDYIDYCGDTEDENYNCAVVLDPDTDEIVKRFDTFDEAEEWVTKSGGKYTEEDICARSEVEEIY